MESSHCGELLAALVALAAFDVVERVGREVLHQEAGHAEQRPGASASAHRQPRLPVRESAQLAISPLPEGSVFGTHMPKDRHAVGQRRRELVAAVDELQRLDLAIGQPRVGRGVRRIRIHAIRTAQGRPGIALRVALRHVEQRARRHVVVDDAVLQAVELVGLAHELGADGRGLGARDPVGRGLFLDADQLRRQHQAWRS